MSAPVWISHRGLDTHWVENSAQAFAAAVAAGFEHLETDLRTTRDGGIALHHDPHMSATAGEAVRVEDLSLAEFTATAYRDGQRGLGFVEFAERFGDCRWILDIKPESGVATLRALKRWAGTPAAERWLLERARFLLWHPQHERALAELFPGAQTLAGLGECRRAGVAVLLGAPAAGGIRARRTYSLPPSLGRLTLYRRNLFRRYQRRGARVLAYLPESEADIRRALAAGADEILIDSTPPPGIADEFRRLRE